MLFELSNVSYRYADGTHALDRIDLEIESGQGYAILGANGSGKSTLLRLLDGLHFPSEGEVRFLGSPVTEQSLQKPDFRSSFRSSVGFVFQNPDAQIFTPTVADEVAFGPRQLGMSSSEITARVRETLQFLGIEDLADRAPFRLSGGEKRKVAIASVLSMNPRVILFDEPLLGLDPHGQTWLVRTIRELRRAGKTVVVATHTLDIVPRIADVAIVLSEQHRILRVGPVSEVFLDDRLLVEANLVESLMEMAAV